MKKYFVVALLLVSGFCLTNCSKESITGTEETSSTDDISEMVSLSVSQQSVAGDSVTHQKCKGKLTSVDISTLSATITNYIKQTYPSATIKLASTDTQGNVIVGIVVDGQPSALLFNSSGAFVSQLKQYGKKAKLTSVAVADLPAAISSYVSTTYAGATIEKAGKNAEGSYFVAIKLNGTVRILQFDTNGVFKEELTLVKPPKKRH